MSLIRRPLLMLLITSIAAVLSLSGFVEAGPSEGKKFNFSPLASFEAYKLEIDNETKHSTVDDDGDTLVGAVVKITPAVAVDSNVPNRQVAAFVNTVVAVCGHDGIILLQSSMFDQKGEHIQTVHPMKAISTKTQTTPSNVIYKHLCTGNMNSRGNKLTWV